MTAVPDVSGVMEILLKTEKGERYNALLLEADFVAAPDLYIPELTNTLWKYCTIKKMPEDKCIRLIQLGINYNDGPLVKVCSFLNVKTCT